MKVKPSLEEFRSGGGEGTLEQNTPAKNQIENKTIPFPSERMNKTIRIRKVFESKLKEDAYHRSIAEGRRITESDIIDEALELYWNLNK